MDVLEDNGLWAAGPLVTLCLALRHLVSDHGMDLGHISVWCRLRDLGDWMSCFFGNRWLLNLINIKKIPLSSSFCVGCYKRQLTHEYSCLEIPECEAEGVDDIYHEPWSGCAQRGSICAMASLAWSGAMPSLSSYSHSWQVCQSLAVSLAPSLFK